MGLLVPRRQNDKWLLVSCGVTGSKEAKRQVVTSVMWGYWFQGGKTTSGYLCQVGLLVSRSPGRAPGIAGLLTCISRRIKGSSTACLLFWPTRASADNKKAAVRDCPVLQLGVGGGGSFTRWPLQTRIYHCFHTHFTLFGIDNAKRHFTAQTKHQYMRNNGTHSIYVYI